MEFNEFQNYIQSALESLTNTDEDDVRNYVQELRYKYPSLTKKQLAEKVINGESFKNGLMGAVTGFGGLATLAVTLPIDLIKALKIQVFMIRCIAEIYDYISSNDDMKIDTVLLLSNSSVNDIQKFVLDEAKKKASKEVLKQLNCVTKEATRLTAELAPKYIAKAALKVADKPIRNYALRQIPKVFRGIIWKLGGRKIAEKSIQKTATKAVPVIGALVGGGLDWFTTQAVGKLTIQYYEQKMPEWLDEIFGICG